MDITYCYEKCQIGKAASDEYLALNNSVIDAAMQFNLFVENCFKVCPHKCAHEKQIIN
jgi:hypothetical protein